MTISLRLSDEDTALIKKYAELNRMTVSELIRQSVIERIEDEYDLKAMKRRLQSTRKTLLPFRLMRWKGNWSCNNVPCCFYQ